MRTFGERLKLVRGTLTQKEFANSIGVTLRAITNYEVQNRKPRGSVIRTICERYQINEQWLLTGEGPMSSNEKMGTVVPVVSSNKIRQPIDNIDNIPKETNFLDNKTGTTVPVINSDDKNYRHVATFNNHQHIENIENISNRPPEEGQKNWRQSPVLNSGENNPRQPDILKVKDELAESLRERIDLQERLLSLIKENAALQIQLKDRDQRIAELEREIERLRGELSLLRSRASGAATG